MEVDGQSYEVMTGVLARSYRSGGRDEHECIKYSLREPWNRSAIFMLDVDYNISSSANTLRSNYLSLLRFLSIRCPESLHSVVD